MEQLVRSFKNAKSPVSQIGILADLNSMSKFEIERILREALGDDVVTGILGRKAQNPKAKVRPWEQNVVVRRSSDVQELCVDDGSSEPVSMGAGIVSVDGESTKKGGEALEEAAQIICERQERKFQSLGREIRDRAYMSVANGGDYIEFLQITGLLDRRQNYRSWVNLKAKAKREGALGYNKSVHIEPKKKGPKPKNESSVNAVSSIDIDMSKICEAVMGQEGYTSNTSIRELRSKLSYIDYVEKLITNLVELRTQLVSDINEMLRVRD